MKNFYSKILRLIPKFIKIFLKKCYYTITANYITRDVKGNKQDYLDIYNSTKNKTYKRVNEFITNNNYKEIDKNFIEDLALISQISIKKSSEANFQHGRLIYSILDSYIKKNFLELKNFLFVDVGTAKGFSSIIISKCAKDNDIDYSIFSFDIIPHNKKIYWNSIMDLEGKLSRETLLKDYTEFTKNINYITGRTKNKLRDISDYERINFVFLDGSHDYDDVKFEYNFIKNKQKKGDIIFFDDVTEGHYDGIVKLIEEINLSNQYEIQKIKSTDFRGYAIAKKL